MADLDEISRLLGSIEASAQHTAEWIEKHEKRDQARYEHIVNRFEQVAEFTNRVEIVEQELLPIKAYIELAKIREYKLAGALVVIGGIVSVFGTVLFMIWKNVTAYFG